ncbi:unnamed protein product [Mytilus coruscus]|uniref:Uncharacterized protein n=1 Tax=Mytilus coruscus TaxID=42192 RepID=A0A6J8F4S3_MYTCO|nr:unnamed protein product [Mytilus coruscus]
MNQTMRNEILGVNEELVSKCSNRPSENPIDISSSIEYSREINVTSKSPTSYTSANNQHLSTNGDNVNEISTTQLGFSSGKIKSQTYYFTTHALTLVNDEVSNRYPTTTEYTNFNPVTQSTTTHTINPTNAVYVSKTLTSTDIKQTGHFITTDIITSIRMAQQSIVSSTENNTIKNTVIVDIIGCFIDRTDKKIIEIERNEILGANEELVSKCSNRPSENSIDISSSIEYSREINVTSKSPTSYTSANNQHLSTNGDNVNEISTTQLGFSSGKSNRKHITSQRMHLP